MKLWKKFVLFTITIISVILSCSRYYIVKKNFLYSIENASNQNTNQLILEKYMIETNIVKIIQEGDEVTDEKILEYLSSLHTNFDNELQSFAIYNNEYDKIYSNIDDIDSIDIKIILNQEKNTYCIRKIENIYYMLFSSYWNINNKIIYIVNAYDVSAIYEEKNRQMSEILFTDIIVLVLSSIIIFIFFKYLTKPISILNKTSKKVASGEFKERVNIQSQDEIGELAKSFNIMAEQIENKINELNLQVKQKNDFINGFTHELKTPMTAIIGYTDLLRLKKCDEELTQKAINYIYSETKRLESLSFKLMKLMSLSKDEIKMNRIIITDLIDKVVKVESDILDNIKIEMYIEEAAIKGDIELLDVVIRNLLENAKKANPKDNKVIIKGEKLSNKKYRISIIDKGNGIPKEHINRVTEDFYMVDKSRSNKNNRNWYRTFFSKKNFIIS